MTTRPVMIMVAPNGARKTKDDHPAIPLTGAEIAAEAVACTRAGASLLHLHVRNNDARHTINPDAYRQVLDEIRAANGRNIIIQATTESNGVYSAQEQMDMVWRVRPEAVSLSIREIAPHSADGEPFAEFLRWLQAEKIVPQFILYSVEELRTFIELQERGIVPFKNPYLLFVLGHYSSGRESEPGDLDPYVETLGDRTMPWSICAFGVNESACVEAAIQAGGHVRVGFENNLCRSDGTVYETNCEAVRAAVETIKRLGHTVMTVAQAREFLAQTIV